MEAPEAEASYLSDYDLLEALDEQQRRQSLTNLSALGERLSNQPVAPHSLVIGSVIDRWIDPKSGLDRLMVLAPPRHMKSWNSSWFAPVAILGRRPGSRIMHVTHTHRLTAKFGRRIRNSIAGPQNPYPDLHLAPDATAKDEWRTACGGEYNAFGFDGSPSGNPADYLIIDDPIKGRKEAQSTVERDSRWEIYQSDLLTRLEGPQKQLFALTRWNQDDPVGRILPEGFNGRSGWYHDRETGERWYVLSLPAVSEHENDPCGRKLGEWLWPGVHDESTAAGAIRRRAEKTKSGRTVWNSLYQQRPAQEEGLLFNIADLRFYDPNAMTKQFLRTLAIYGASDYAVKEPDGEDDPDYTVHMVFGVDPLGNIYMLDMWRGRQSSNVWVEQFINLIERWRPVRWAEEDGQIIKGVGPFISLRLRECMSLGRDVAVSRVQFTSAVDKTQRARSIIGMTEMNRLFLPKGKPWLPGLISEIKSFPNARHDDQVDTLSLFGRLLTSVMKGRTPPPGADIEEGSIDELWSIHEGER